MWLWLVFFLQTLFLFLVDCTPLQGVVLLDSLTFNRTVGAFPFSLVKFDSGYPTGDAHRAWAVLGQELSEVENLLVAEVVCSVLHKTSKLWHTQLEREKEREGVRVREEKIKETEKIMSSLCYLRHESVQDDKNVSH